MIGFKPYETFELLLEAGGANRADTLLVAACDAFVRLPKPAAAEYEQFETLVERLFPKASETARARAASILASSAHLSQLLEQLVVNNIGDRIDAFLVNAESISDNMLLDVVESGNIDHIAMIAKRRDLTKNLISKIFPLNSRKIYRALANNQSIHFSGPYLRAMSKAAAMDVQVAQRLATREDFDKAYLLPAFFNLDTENRIEVLTAFQDRKIPRTNLHHTFDHISVATPEFTQAMMKLLSKNKRPEVTRLLTQITGLDEVTCGKIAHDVSGAAFFIILRAFGCNEFNGVKVLIHATARETNSFNALAQFARLFKCVEPEAMVFAMSVWRGDIEISALDAKPNPDSLSHAPVVLHRRGSGSQRSASGSTQAIEQAMREVRNLRTVKAS